MSPKDELISKSSLDKIISNNKDIAGETPATTHISNNKDTSGETPAINQLIENKDYYLENGFCVFTAEYLKNRGYCCKSGCRHCPY